MKKLIVLAAFAIFFGLSIEQSHAKETQKVSVATPAQTVIRFYKWYTKNKKSLNEIDPFDGKPGDTTTFYKLNNVRLNRYFRELMKCNMISSVFISDLNQQYRCADYTLKLYPQNDGPIEELEFDIIYGVQEEEDITKHLNQIKMLAKSIKGNKAFVRLGIGKDLRIRAYLTKKNGTWLIDHLSPHYLPLITNNRRLR